MQPTNTLPLFRRSRALESEIHEFLDKISESSLMFKIAIRMYLSDGYTLNFEQKLHDVNKMESDADNLRRSIGTKLYSQIMMSGSRGDVLNLIENLDPLLNRFEDSLWAFSIEKPDISDAFKADFAYLTDMVVQAVDALVLASHAFFSNVEEVGDHKHKVMFFEKEADKVSTKLKKAIFGSNLDLSQKKQLRNFVEYIDNVADWAEDVADRLAIYYIKRTV